MLRHLRSPVLAGYLATLMGLAPLPALANPQGGQVVGGAATIGGQGTSHVTVNQASQRAIINWQSFNIGVGERTQFIQPGADAIALNRVTGPHAPSTILGTLDANGRVFLVNPDGILFGSNAVINTAGFLASTHDIKNDDFMAGRNHFTIPGNPSASVVNLGQITATNAGIAALVAPGVRNSGTITAELGKVALASNNGFTLDFYGDKLITLQVDGVVASQVKDVQTGQTLDALVKNEGVNAKLSANGGRVELTAAAARQVVDAVINNAGVVEANWFGTKNGRIVLGAATASTKGAIADVQKVRVGGTLSAAGKNDGEQGGKVRITGESIALANARVDASGKAGGGSVQIGGAVKYFDRGVDGVVAAPTDTATTTTIDAASVIDASGRNLSGAVMSGAGDGGRIGIWADQSNSVAGGLFATGGMTGGTGGEIFVGARTGLAFTGGTDTRGFFSIGEVSMPTHGTTYLGAGGDVTIGSSGTSFVQAGAVSNSLANGNVEVLAGLPFEGFPAVSNMAVADSIAWATNTHLSLKATHHLAVGDGVTIANTFSGIGTVPRLSLYAGLEGGGGGTVSFGAGAAVNFGQSSGVVDVWHNPAQDQQGNRLSVADNVLMDGGKSQRLTEYWWINTVTDLQNIYMDLGANYALSRNISPSMEPQWAGVAFVPLGDVDNSFQGQFDGRGHTISGLTITSSATNIGLFGVIGRDGSVRDVRLAGVNVTALDGAQNAGTLAGTNYGSIVGVSASGVVGNASTPSPLYGGFGGLVGSNGGTGSITASSANVDVTVHGPTYGYIDAGGLVGINAGGSIDRSFADGSVTGVSYSSASGTYLGGLVGWNTGGGTISRSYASGAVSGTGSYGFGGGLVGVNTSDVSHSYALGAVTLSGSDSTAGGLVGSNGGTISQGYATGAVDAANGAVGGGFAGSNSNAIVQSFWDMGTAGLTNAVGTGSADGITGLTTAQARQSGSYAGFDFATTWFMVEGGTRPFLRAEWSDTITNAHQLQLVSMNPGADYRLANDINMGELANPSGMWDPAKGFVPIASVWAPFTGFFDGGNHFINNLTITPNDAGPNATQSIGLFASIGVGGVVRDLNMLSATVAANPGYTGPGQFVGTVAGQNAGIIDHVWVGSDGPPASSVTAAESLSGIIAGGLVGQNGIFGPNAGTGTILDSGARVAVTIGSGCGSDCLTGGWNYAGGLVGFNPGFIAGSDARGDVTVGSHAFGGGLVGMNQNYVSNGESITPIGGAVVANSWAEGRVTSAGTNVAIGGLVGANAQFAVIRNSSAFGDVETTGQVTPGPSGSFVSAGGLVGQNEGVIGGNPALPLGSTAPDLIAGCTIGMTCAGGQVSVGANATGGGLVGSNSGTIGYAYAMGNVVGAAGLPVDGHADAATALGGLVGFNGGVLDSVLAFGRVGGPDNAPAPANLLAGGLVGDNTGRIANAFAFGSVDVGAHSTAGGLAGYNDGTVVTSMARGNVSAGVEGIAGGLVGENSGDIVGDAALPVGGDVNSLITGCLAGQTCAVGDVTVGGNGLAGGLVGANSGSIAFAYATGNVFGAAGSANGADTEIATLLGGLVGGNNGLISNAFAFGDVLGIETNGVRAGGMFAGGLVGGNLGAIENAYAFGAVAAGDSSIVGGLVGASVPVNVLCGQCGFFPDSAGVDAGVFMAGAFGNVSAGANSYVGGAVGYVDGTGSTQTPSMSFVTAMGNVSGGAGSAAGGVAGMVDAGAYLWNVSGIGTVAVTGAASYAGGVAGYNAGLIHTAAAVGDVSATGTGSYVGGFVGANAGLIHTSVASGDAAAAGGASYVGGFAGLNTGRIENSGATGNVAANGATSAVGGLVGWNDSTGTLVDVYYLASPGNGVYGTSDSAIGGLVGRNLGTVTGFAVDPPVAGSGSGNHVGGAVGDNSGTLQDGTVIADVSGGSGSTAGAVTGLNSGSVNGVTFTGTVNGVDPNVTPTDPPADDPPPINQNQFVNPPDPTQNTVLVQNSDPTPPQGAAGGSGGQGGGTGGPGGTGNNNPPPPQTGPPPGPGIGRTVHEQRFSGVPPIGETRFLPGEVVVQVSNTVSPERIQEVARGLGITLIASQAIDGSGRVVYRFSTGGSKDIRDVIRALERQQIVASAQPNYVFGLAQDLPRGEPMPAGDPADATGALPPSPELSSDLQSDMAARTTGLPKGDAAQYIIDKLRLGIVHARAQGRNVTVAVIDSEIDAQHPDLAGVVAESFDATGTASNPHAHGTGMAGAIASKRRLLGIAPEVRILAVKAFDETNTSAEATSFQILKGLDWAIARKARIVNMSFAGPRDLMLERALQKAYDAGIVLVAAAGNAGPKSPPLYPAADVNVIAVSASDFADKPFAMANRGKHIAVAAPGVDVLVPGPKGSYQLTTGTSVAAAHVSGVAALLLESKPSLTPKEVRALLVGTARPVNVKGGAETFGAGLIDPVQALSRLTARTVEATPASRTVQ